MFMVSLHSFCGFKHRKKEAAPARRKISFPIPLVEELKMPYKRADCKDFIIQEIMELRHKNNQLRAESEF